MTGKQRAYLRGLANSVPAKYQIGKAGYLEENFINQLREGLEKNEIVKVRVLENADVSPREASDAICRIIDCEGVQVIGTKFVLYKESEKNKTIVLPK